LPTDILETHYSWTAYSPVIPLTLQDITLIHQGMSSIKNTVPIIPSKRFRAGISVDLEHYHSPYLPPLCINGEELEWATATLTDGSALPNYLTFDSTN